MGKPLVRRLVDVEMAAKGFDRRHVLRTAIDQRTLLRVEGSTFRLALDNIGTQERVQLFSNPSYVRDDRKVSPQSVT